ncbi:MAG: DNA repair protein RecO [Calditrichaeota bacterium]|nr:DNA repair protein RecO [Calditrichota bacterium]
MSLQKTEAIILKTQKQGETSKILTLFTKSKGILKVIAKGSRGPKSRYFGTLEPLNHIAIVYYFKETRDLQLLSQADIVGSFIELREKLEKYAIAVFCCELVQRTQLEQPNAALFRDLLALLRALNGATGRLMNFLFWFVLRFLDISGFKPELNQCQVCGTTRKQGVLRFSILRGGFSCDKCQAPDPMSISVNGEILDFLLNIQLGQIQQIASYACPSVEESETLLLSFLQYHIEETQYVKSLKFLKNIQNHRF